MEGGREGGRGGREEGQEEAIANHATSTTQQDTDFSLTEGRVLLSNTMALSP